MAKKTTKKDNFRTMTWKEAYSFCAAHVLVEKKRATRPMLHHVAIRLAAGKPSMVILAATSGQTAAFLEMGIGWLASVLPALPAQLEGALAICGQGRRPVHLSEPATSRPRSGM